MDAIRADMVKGSGDLRYGLGKFEGGYFVQVMRGASLGGTNVDPDV